MAHNLRMVDGKASMAYAGDIPWHGLGTQVPGLMTMEEVLTKAGLNYDVHKVALFTEAGVKAPAYATVAGDTGAILGVVGERYQILQNREALQFGDDLVGLGGARYETAGALGQGEKIWTLMRMPDTLAVVPGDEIVPYLLLSNTHDGSGAVEARYTTIRVVCQNTLHMAMGRSSAVVKLKHTKTVAQRLSMAATILAGYQEHFGQFSDCMKRLQAVRITDEMIDAFEVSMFGAVEDLPEGRSRSIRLSNMQTFEELLVKGKGTEIPGVAGTAYGMLNAYTEWADFHSQVRGTDDRTNAIVFGNAAANKTKALETALALVSA